MTSDISTGGIAMATTSPWEIGTHLLLEMRVMNRTLLLTGRVVRCLKKTVNEQASYLLGVEFIGIESQTERHIARYVFQQQTQAGKL